MKLKTVMVIKALVCLTLGVPILLMPVFTYSLFVIDLDSEGVYPAWQYGAALIGNMLLTWFARNAVDSDALRAIILALCIYDAIGLVLTLIALFTGSLGILGWFAVVIYLFFTLGFGYFLLPQKKAA